MGCNCQGGNKNNAPKWTYTAPSGASSTYNSEVEARAAKIRNGNQGTVTRS